MKITEESLKVRPITIVLETQEEIDQLYVLLNHTTVNDKLRTHDRDWYNLHKILGRQVSKNVDKLFNEFHSLIR